MYTPQSLETVSENQLKTLLSKLLKEEGAGKEPKYPIHQDAIEPWVRAMTVGTLTGRPFSHHTVKNYLRYVQYFVSRYGGISHEDLEREFLETPIDMFGRKDKFYRAIMCFAKFLDRNHSLSADFWDQAKRLKPKRHVPPKRHSLTESELETLYLICENPTQELMVRLLATTGLRASEFCSLTLGDVDFETRCLIVQRGKGGKRRKVGLNELTLDLLKQHLDIRQAKSPEDYLFLNTCGQQMERSGLLNRLRRLGRLAGLKVSPHALRRSFVTINANKGRSLVMLQIACGHSDIKTTRSYCQTSEDEVIQAMQEWQ